VIGVLLLLPSLTKPLFKFIWSWYLQRYHTFFDVTATEVDQDGDVTNNSTLRLLVVCFSFQSCGFMRCFVNNSMHV